MAAPRRKQDETRKVILQTAAKLLATRGFQGTSTRAIAAEAGIRQPTLFHHFESKWAILGELLDRDLEPAVTIARALCLSPGSPAARLFAHNLNDLRRLVEWPYDVRGMYSSDLLQRPELAVQRKHYEEFLAYCRNIIEQGISSGELQDVPPSYIMLASAGFFFTTAWSPGVVVDSLPPDWPDAACELLFRAILRDPTSLPRVRHEGEALLALLTDRPLTAP